MFKLTFNKKLFFLKTFSIQSSLEILDSKKLITKKEFNLFSVYGVIFSLADGIATVVNFSDSVIFGEVVFFIGLESLSVAYMAISNWEANAVLIFLLSNSAYIILFLVHKSTWRI